jgi:endonuclease/exonuclease/phosphatase family metal-dependent hydrolase
VSPSRRSGGLIEALLFAAGAAAVAWAVLGTKPGAARFDPTKPQGAYRVVTWNVGAGLARGAGGGLADDAIDHVARVLRRLEPDLVFLQEVHSQRQLAALRNKLGPRCQSRLARGTDPLRVAALAVEGGFAGTAAGGDARTLHVRHLRPGKAAVEAAGLHADAFSTAARNRQVGAAVDALLARPAAVHVLAGDFNIDLDLDKRRDLFTDDEHRDVETFNYALARMRDAAHGTGSTAEPDRRLDYVLVAFADPAARVLGGGVFRGARAKDMDHDPVVVDLLLP